VVNHKRFILSPVSSLCTHPQRLLPATVTLRQMAETPALSVYRLSWTHPLARCTSSLCSALHSLSAALSWLCPRRQCTASSGMPKVYGTSELVVPRGRLGQAVLDAQALAEPLAQIFLPCVKLRACVNAQRALLKKQQQQSGGRLGGRHNRESHRWYCQTVRLCCAVVCGC
jgi:hypothetical protein